MPEMAERIKRQWQKKFLRDIVGVLLFQKSFKEKKKAKKEKT